MRTTIDIPEREHALFSALAHDHGTSLSKLVVGLALRGLRSQSTVSEASAGYEVDSETGLPVFRSGHPVTIDDVRALEDRELDRHGPFA